jgi:integrase
MKPFKDLALGVIAQTKAESQLTRRIQYWIDYLGEKNCLEVTVEDCDAGIEALAQRGKLKYLPKIGTIALNEPLSGATLNRHVSALGFVYKHAKRLRHIPKGFSSPTKGADKAKEDNARTINLSKEQITRVVDASRLMRWHKFTAFVCVAMSTGARVGNLQTMKWGDIDLSKGTVFFPTSKNGKPYTSALSPLAVTELRRIKTEHDYADTPIFGRKNYRRSWELTLEYAEVKYFCFHGCRHIAASLLSLSGASIPLVMAQMNHKTPSMAIRYSHLNTDQLIEQVHKAFAW